MVFDLDYEEHKLLTQIGQVADRLSYPAYLVGGFVRDRLIGRETKDIDIVCIGSGIRLAQEVSGILHPKPRLVIYKRFGTAALKHKGFEIEFVGARKESYRPDSRKPVVEEGTLEDDQNRRDFTINALAVSLADHNFGKIVDPFDGLEDLQKRIIKTPSNPSRTFSDDPLRMIRGIRFASQLDYQIDSHTLESIKKNKNRIKIVSRERITSELNKIIMSPIPSVGFDLLFDTGLLKLIFPEMATLQGVETQQGKSHKDNFYHTLEVLDNLSLYTENIWLRWSAILHDIAKPATKRFDVKSGWTFHGHEALGASMVPKIFAQLRLPLDHKMKYVQKLVRLHLRPISLTKSEVSESAIRRLVFEAGKDIDDLMLLCNADITSKNEYKVAKYRKNYELVRKKIQEVEDRDKLRNWQPPISGDEIMETFKLNPSKEVGLIKTSIREAILDGIIPNDKESATKFMIQKAKEMGIIP